MFATNHAQGLYRGIEKYGGGSIRELTLRCEAGNISHGTFIAARQELCELGLIAIERIAVFCQAIFLIFIIEIPHRHRGKIPTFSRSCQEAGSTTASCRMRACSIR